MSWRSIDEAPAGWRSIDESPPLPPPAAKASSLVAELVVLVALASWLWLKEPHPAQRLIGAAIVLIGICLLAV